jgi:hypothetical protein
MKIYKREEFMKLPKGVMYCKGQPWYFEDLSIKGETLVHGGENADFCTQGTSWIESSGSDQAVKRLDEMLESGVSYPIETDGGRDGCFDDDDLFLVYEKSDLLILKSFIDQAINIYMVSND